MRAYSIILALCAAGLTLVGGAIRDASSSAVTNKSVRKSSGSPNEPVAKSLHLPNQQVWTLLEGCGLTASSNGSGYSTYTESNPLTVDHGYLRLEAPPGSWGFIFCDASLIPPDPNDQAARDEHDDLVDKFPSLAAQLGNDLGVLSEGELPYGLNFIGPTSYLATVLLLPLTVYDPEYEAESPNNPYNTLENSIRRFYQPVVANSSGAAQYLPWDANFAGWSSPTVDAPDVGAMMRDEWIRVAAGKTEKTLLDFRVLWEMALSKEFLMTSESTTTFYTGIPQGQTMTYVDRARAAGLRLRCQAVFLRVANPSPINSNPLTIGGLTGIGTGAQVSIGLSSFLQINIQVPNGLDELDTGIDVHTPGFTCYAGETTKMLAYGVTGTASTLRFRKLQNNDNFEFDVSCERAGVGKIKFVIPEEHTGPMVIVSSQNDIGTRVYPYAATDVITVLQ